MQASNANPWIFGAIIAVVVVLDVITKAMAEYALVPMYTPHNILGEFLRFTLVYNRGAAFGINVGSASRLVFILLTFIALVVLWRLYRSTPEGAYSRTSAIALVTAGAIGNLIDRIRSSQGVVDFIDVGIGLHRWPTFNVADIAVSTGAAILAWVLFQEDRAEAAAKNLAASARDN